MSISFIYNNKQYTNFDISDKEIRDYLKSEGIDIISIIQKEIIKRIKEYAYKELSKTDWKVIRHRDQKEAGLETSLSDSDYILLLSQRQKIRTASNEIEASIIAINNIEELINFDIEKTFKERMDNAN